MRAFEIMDRWHKEIEENCKYKQEREEVSIPPLLPECKLTGGVCDFNECPRVKEIMEE